MKTPSIAGLLFLFMVLAASPQAAAQESRGTPGHTFESVTFERGECGFACPEYEVTVFKSGEVRWVGHQNVKKVGTFQKSVSAEEVRRIPVALKAAHWKLWAAEYHSDTSDVATLKLTVRWSGGSKSVVWDQDGLGVTKDLDRMGALIDEVAGIKDWVGPR